MSSHLNGRTAACAALLGMALAPLAALAGSDATNVATSTPPAAANMTVVRDAQTGQLRAPTPEEAAALAPAVRPAAATFTPRSHPSGARGARMSDATLSYSVMVRQPDGSLAEQCFDSAEAAKAATLAAPTNQASALPTK